MFRSTVPPASSGHIFSFKTFAAIDSTSVRESPDAIAAKTSIPFPIEEITCVSTVTEAEVTLCRMAMICQNRCERGRNSRKPFITNEKYQNTKWIL